LSVIIETHNLSKWYGNILGISDVTIKIEEGVSGLLGPNGAGKSTFLKLITGQIKSSLGWVKILGQPIRNNPSLLASMGYCPEQDVFYEELTGWQFVMCLLRLHDISYEQRQSKAENALSVVDLFKDKDRVIKTYSRGMRQRLKLAQVLAHDPDILVLDEPLNGLDPLGRRKIIHLVKEYEKKGKTVIVSSHVLPEIEAMTQKIILMHQGKVFAQGDIHSIRDLIDTHPHIVSIKCNNPRLLAEKLIHEDFIFKVQFGREGKTLIVETDDRDNFFNRIPLIVMQENILVEEITSPDDNLQAVFDYLIGK